MNVPVPHYLLLSEGNRDCQPGAWQFQLRSLDGSERLVVRDFEPDVRGERLELLTVVRGLEALDQPSRVTVVTPSLYVRRGIEQGISEWRSNGWRWEFFGEMVPVRDSDLWRRLDRAMRFHQLTCRPARFGSARTRTSGSSENGVVRAELSEVSSGNSTRAPGSWERAIRLFCAAGRLVASWLSRLVPRAALLGPCFRVDKALSISENVRGAGAWAAMRHLVGLRSLSHVRSTLQGGTRANYGGSG